jgi:hypothetical protein
MSTFYGGEQLAQSIALSDGSPGVKYTVPAGNYAKVIINTARRTSAGDAGLSIGQTNFEIGNNSGTVAENIQANMYSTAYTNSSAVTNGVKIGELYLNAGETVTIATNVVSVFSATVLLYKNP